MVTSKTRSIIYLVLAAAAYGGIGIFAKLLLNSIVPLGVAALRILFMVLALFVLVLITSGLKQVKIKLSELKNYVLLGFIVFLGMFFSISSFQHISVIKAVLIYYTNPLWVVLLAYIFLKERISKNVIYSIIGAFAGLLVMFGPHLGKLDFSLELLGMFYALLASFLMAVFMVSTKKRVKQKTVKHTLWTFSFALIFLGAAFIISEGMTSLIFITPINWTLLAGFGVISTLFPIFLWTAALKHIDVSVASIILLLDPVFAAILAFMILYEVPSSLTLLGGILILISAVLASKN